MAPNRKVSSSNCVDDSLSLDLRVVRPKDHAATLPTRNVVENSESYWEWTTPAVTEESPRVIVTKDLFSADHIVANLLASVVAPDQEATLTAVVINTSVTTQEASDAYWAEATQSTAVEELTANATAPLHLQEQSKENSAPAVVVGDDEYWKEASAFQPSESDNYWQWRQDDSNAKLAVLHMIHTSNVESTIKRNPEDMDAYWDWSHKPTASDSYWAEECKSPETTVSGRLNVNYWNERSYQRTSNDRYWSWSS